MGTHTIAIIAAVIAVLVTPIYIWLLAKGVKSLSDIRDLFRRPPGDYGRRGSDPH